MIAGREEAVTYTAASVADAHRHAARCSRRPRRTSSTAGALLRSGRARRRRGAASTRARPDASSPGASAGRLLFPAVGAGRGARRARRPRRGPQRRWRCPGSRAGGAAAVGPGRAGGSRRELRVLLAEGRGGGGAGAAPTSRRAPRRDRPQPGLAALALAARARRCDRLDARRRGAGRRAPRARARPRAWGAPTDGGPGAARPRRRCAARRRAWPSSQEAVGAARGHARAARAAPRPWPPWARRCAWPGGPTDAREPLRRALELGDVCGADAAGRACPHRAATPPACARAARRSAGVESLTPSERRVADLAAAGQHQPRRRAGALRDAQDGRGPPEQRVPQARDPFAARARRARWRPTGTGETLGVMFGGGVPDRRGVPAQRCASSRPWTRTRSPSGSSFGSPRTSPEGVAFRRRPARRRSFAGLARADGVPSRHLSICKCKEGTRVLTTEQIQIVSPRRRAATTRPGTGLERWPPTCDPAAIAYPTERRGRGRRS